MAVTSALPWRSLVVACLPVVRGSPLLETRSRTASLIYPTPLLRQLQYTLFSAAIIPIPSLWESIWEGILKAVPKKKTSHSYVNPVLLAKAALTKHIARHEVDNWLERLSKT